MGTQNPEDNANVVCDLWLLKAWTLQKITNDLKALPCAEFSGQLIGLEQGHQSEGIGVMTKLQRVDVILLHNPAEEFSCLLVAFFEFFRSTRKKLKLFVKLTR